MMMPSSTSQSDFWDAGGMTTSSFGPMMAEVAFMKMMGSAGIFIVGFRGMVAVIETDAYEFAYPAHRLAKASAAGTSGRLARITVSSAAKPGRQQCRGDIRNDAGQIAAAPLGIQDSGLLLTFGADVETVSC